MEKTAVSLPINHSYSLPCPVSDTGMWNPGDVTMVPFPCQIHIALWNTKKDVLFDIHFWFAPESTAGHAGPALAAVPGGTELLWEMKKGMERNWD